MVLGFRLKNPGLLSFIAVQDDAPWTDTFYVLLTL